MKRLLLTLIVLAVAVSGCALGRPLPTTYVSDIGATLNGDVYSTVAGETEIWWRYGETTGYGRETPHRTVSIADAGAHPLSEPISGLAPATTYHLQLCARDAGESPPRTVCQSDRTFTTGPAGGKSGIAFTSFGDLKIFAMSANGANQTSLSPNATLDINPSWSPDGRRIAFSSFRDGDFEIYAMDADGSNHTRLTEVPGTDSDAAWSPDGTRIAFDSDAGGVIDIYLVDPDGGNLTNLTQNPGSDYSPAWSPDGRTIAFNTETAAGYGIYLMNADGSNQRPLVTGPGDNFGAAWSPDGTKIAFTSTRTPAGIYVVNRDGTHPTYLTGPAGGASWSPSGAKIAFGANGTGSGEIYVMDSDGTDLVRLTNRARAENSTPDWSRRP